MVNEITRALIVKACREKHFRARAVRIDSTVIEADVKYPTDSGLAAQGVRALAREGKIGGALSTLRAVRDLPGSSKYLPALEGRLWAKEQDWKRAWNAVAPLVSAQE